MVKRVRIGALVDGSIGIDISIPTIDVDVATRSQMLLSTRFGRRAQYLESGVTILCSPRSQITKVWTKTYDYIPYIDYQRIIVPSANNDVYAMWTGEDTGLLDVNWYCDVKNNQGVFFNWSNQTNCYFIYTLYRLEAA